MTLIATVVGASTVFALIIFSITWRQYHEFSVAGSSLANAAKSASLVNSYSLEAVFVHSPKAHRLLTGWATRPDVSAETSYSRESAMRQWSTALSGLLPPQPREYGRQREGVPIKAYATLALSGPD